MKKQYDKIGENYLSAQRSFSDQREVWLKNIVKEFLPDITGKIVLDMGCGDGTDAAIYKQMGAGRVIGVDPSEYMIKQAQAKNLSGCTFLLGEYEKNPVRNGEIDIVMGNFSLHYLTCFDAAFQEIARILAPRGYAVFLVPHPFYDFSMKTNKDFKLQEIISVNLYDGKVKVSYPSHNLSDYFSSDFFRYFSLENLREYIPKEFTSNKNISAALLFKARKK